MIIVNMSWNHVYHIYRAKFISLNLNSLKYLVKYFFFKIEKLRLIYMFNNRMDFNCVNIIIIKRYKCIVINEIVVMNEKVY